MTFEEKNTWVFALTTLLGFGAYVVVLVLRAQGIALVDVAYVVPMLASIRAANPINIAGHVFLASTSTKEERRKDVRDREIERLGDYTGQAFLVIGGLVALGLSMAEISHFWIAHTLYLGFVLSALLGSATKLAAYREAFQSW